MSLPKTTDAWVIQSIDKEKGLRGNLKLEKGKAIPELGENDVLVQIQAVSLNYRDLVIPLGMYPLPLGIPVVACSDGAGRVLATGKKVKQFEEGDKVVTLFNQAHQHGPITTEALGTGLGGAIDGTLRQYAVFAESGLARAPSNLSPTEAGTLTCAPLTAWNALYGLESKALQPGQTVLTQGTGGVSLAAIQFAKAAGATVIATTSSDEKAKRLEKMGADIVLNYKTDPNWGETAKRLSPGKAGVDIIVEVGGPGTMAQSLKAIKLEGVIAVIGFLGGPSQDDPGTLASLMAGCIIRGILIGSKAQLNAMNRAIDANNIHPIVDEKVFKFEDAPDAYEYQWEQKNFGKVVIQL
ncbi:alcohol dehydrogenase [Exophiala viscosa]|uniref:Alcohol dehydrogenase n=1 Tax=Exophiala viscosa TaxID=2486360 RepID=A0AAN6DQJ5_9EURO|nr:alcohol dehydrogenase [Exophiala viscosa]KAI1629000.1 alcohol dehydrogenase [Exophiala viscosa]